MDGHIILKEDLSRGNGKTFLVERPGIYFRNGGNALWADFMKRTPGDFLKKRDEQLKTITVNAPC